MLRAPTRRLYERLGPRYLRLALAAQFQLTHLVVLGGLWVLTLFVHVGSQDLWRIIVVSQALVVVENVYALKVSHRLLRPADAWLGGDHSPEAARRAWRALAALPVDFLRHRKALAVLLNVVPISVYVVLELHQPLLPGLPAMIAGAAVVLLYGVLLRFFFFEIVTRPVLEDISRDVEPDADLGPVTLPLRGRLLLAMPVINVIGGVIVSGLSGGGQGFGALGLGVAFAILVAFTVSLELSLLLAKSILGPLRAIQRGTQAVAAGDLTVRVPVVTADETGQLAASFNVMVAGLAERERLHEAFGAYVDPDVAERVLAEGTQLEGEEVEVTVVFIDIRDFTAFAERSTAREVVAALNAFYDRVVPVLARHGGHANKFVGDGLLAVFGAPQRLEDHADRAVAAALEIVELVDRTWGADLRIGAGVNTGTVLAGTVGGGGRVDFTVIGDAVNTAARVEALTRVTGDAVLVTEATLRRLRGRHGGFEERPTTELRGKTERVRVYAACRAAGAAVPAAGDGDAAADAGALLTADG
jgi:adenylate cyclase